MRCVVVLVLAEVLFQFPRHLVFALGIHFLSGGQAGLGCRFGCLFFVKRVGFVAKGSSSASYRFMATRRNRNFTMRSVVGSCWAQSS